jgi:sigma-B regulation protein RsbU (phosphoserine phosphatase)
MTKTACFRAKNAMLFANIISNTFGVATILFLSRGIGYRYPADLVQLASRITQVFVPLAFIVPLIITVIYERPIREYLNMLRHNQSLGEKTVLRARRKLLNEPFFLIGLDFIIWLLAAIIYSGMFWMHGAGSDAIRDAFFLSFFTGLITLTIAFFVFEFILQRRVVRYFFPQGGLSSTPGTLRIRIRTRLIALLLAVNVVPLLSIFGDIMKIFPITGDAEQSLQQLQIALYAQIFIFICVGIWMIFLVSSNLTKPFQEIIHVLRNIKKGDFKSRVQVTSNDEIGFTGDVINEMTKGLIERDRIRQSLHLAKEIQQNLFPKEKPILDNLDMAGRSVYCDETGGDYYDFIPIGSSNDKKLGIAIGDVSGHGIPAALLMATVRAQLRQRASLSGSPSQIISDVNRQLAMDVEYSGDFMTLFFLMVDMTNKELEWVRAGHDPAIVYDPHSDSFEELNGDGIALGVDGQWVFQDNVKKNFKQGQIILMGTDGVWETQNQKGKRIGKQPVYDIIRKHRPKKAAEILEAIFDTLDVFQKGARHEDDVTLVIIKF